MRPEVERMKKGKVNDYSQLRASGLPISESWYAPRGKILMTGFERNVIMHPSDYMRLRHGGRTPLWTRHMLGVREAERDQRRRAKRA